MKGKLFVISGPSGVGKNTILNRLVEERENVRYSISATSRPIRPGEVDGVSYYFVSREQFDCLREITAYLTCGLSSDSVSQTRSHIRFMAYDRYMMRCSSENNRHGHISSL